MTRPFLAVILCAGGLAAQTINSELYSGLRWRMIGPFRGGRTVAAAGIPSQPSVFYVGVNNGGVWKTNDFGHTWKPIFDDQPTGSVGALAIAPSNPNIIYVGSGEGLQRPDLSTGDGVFKSIDGGSTWRHIGLPDAQQIGAIVVDPRNSNRVFVAVLGHAYGPNAQRGVFRSTNGGETWQKVLYKDENTGAIALEFDPTDPQTIYADLWAGRQGPWENGAWNGPNSGLFKSTDGGDTWRQLTKGLPATSEGLARIGFAIAPSDPHRMYAMVESGKLSGVYRSSDAGESWERVNSEARVCGRGNDFAEVKVYPRDKDVIYVANTSTYRSTDAGKTFTAIKGAPGGDDYHTIWINPDHPEIILIAADQGATVTVNGGQTWSSWYNQPTAQLYHVNTDNRFPYWVYSGQQESGSVGIASRGDNGAITFRDWRTVGAEEYGYVVPDPLDPNIIYGGKLTRYDFRTAQAQNIAPEAVRSKFRFLRTAPIAFSPIDPHILYYAGNVLFKTINRGHSWEVVSPDLSREQPEVPENIGVYRTPEMAKQPRRGVIYALALSPRDASVIWAGTDDGLIHITRDAGKTWKSVTPPALTAWSKVSILDAGHFDVGTAYAAVNRIRLDDQRPHIYRTHDFGKTWTEIVQGLPANAPVNAVREDPVRAGLLYAGTERAVHFSIDDGANWQPLRQNMPATSVRDVVVHKDDLVAGTHGRSFWILDDITPLRQLNAKSAETDVILFKPQTAWRVRRNLNTDTPLPPEEPAGENPPDGAILYYRLKTAASAPVTVEIFDGAKRLVRRFTSADPPDPADPDLNVPTYWIRPPRNPPATAGMHRFVWDLHYPPPDALQHEYPISAIYRDTPRFPLGPAVLPGLYTVKLTVDGHTFTQPLTVKMDPRVKTLPEALARQFALSTSVCEMMHRDAEALKKAKDSETKETLTKLNEDLTSLLGTLEEVDAAPTTQAAAAVTKLRAVLDAQLAKIK